ncbi:MAG: NAD(P) transhydrogenase subunit alpha [Alphaproteobacteria bacterium]
MSSHLALESAQKAQAAAELARDAATTAQAYADAAAAAVEAGGQAMGVSGVVDPFVFRLAIFVLAIFVGYFVVWSVTPALHTPLMSVTNAISSVIIVGALLAAGATLFPGQGGAGPAQWLGFAALVMASVNIFGGFLVTRRMLAMYKKKG